MSAGDTLRDDSGLFIGMELKAVRSCAVRSQVGVQNSMRVEEEEGESSGHDFNSFGWQKVFYYKTLPNTRQKVTAGYQW